MNKPLTLTEKILNVIAVSPKPITASEIRRALPDAVDAAEVSARLAKLSNREFISFEHTVRRALTGRKLIKCYSIKPVKKDNDNYYQHGNIFPLLPQTQ